MGFTERLPSRGKWVLLFACIVAVVGCRKARPEPEPTQRTVGALAREAADALPSRATPSGRILERTITAAPAEISLGAGGKTRVWAYDGQVPGPTLRVRLGDTVRVTLVNHLPQPTTIHWHGLRVPNGMDGVPTIERPAIEPGSSFTYEFTPKDAGTYWFHPHIRSSEQVERGLYGVLVVEDLSPPPYDADVVWVLDDFLLDERGQIVEEFNTPHDLAHDGRWGNAIAINGRERETLRLRSGERVRIRMINVANGRVFAPDFGRLDAKIIAVDGLYVREPFPARGFEMAPGNRIDVDVTADAVASEHVAVVDRFIARRSNPLADVIVDGIREGRTDLLPPSTRLGSWSQALEEPIAKEVHLDARRGGPYGIEWTLNGVAFSGHDHGASPIVTMTAGRLHRLRFVNDSYRLHPIHLHGTFFRLLARSGAATDEAFFRDTVLVHAKETVDVAVVPFDEGDWMLHCHVLEHAEAGMMTTFRVE